MEEKKCPHCSFILPQQANFCPNCGKEVLMLSVSLSKQIYIYVLSAFLPPLGLWPGIKYMKSSNEQVKRVGLIAIIITIISSIITLWITMGVVNQITSSVNKQLEQYQSL